MKQVRRSWSRTCNLIRHWPVRATASPSSTLLTPASRIETYEYDPSGMYVTKATNSLGQSVTSQWRTGLGVVKRRVDVNGNAVDISHDNFGRVTREVRPDGTQTDYVLFDCATGCG